MYYQRSTAPLSGGVGLYFVPIAKRARLHRSEDCRRLHRNLHVVSTILMVLQYRVFYPVCPTVRGQK